jgi:hypothetical protein
LRPPFERQPFQPLPAQPSAAPPFAPQPSLRLPWRLFLGGLCGCRFGLGLFSGFLRLTLSVLPRLALLGQRYFGICLCLGGCRRLSLGLGQRLCLLGGLGLRGFLRRLLRAIVRLGGRLLGLRLRFGLGLGFLGLLFRGRRFCDGALGPEFDLDRPGVVGSRRKPEHHQQDQQTVRGR